MSDQTARREFLKNLGAIGAGSVAAIVPVGAEAAQSAAPAAAALPTSPPVSHAYLFLTPPEAAFIEAAVDRFIPADDLTPSGTDCGVASFIDRQLAGAWGSGDRLYMQGPWQKGSPTQGYQLPLTPAELFRTAIREVNTHCVKAHQKEFDRLTIAQQVEVLQGLERGQIALGSVPAQEFFNLLLNAAMQGFFADPMYGGNRDKAAWKMIGYPGVIAIHSENIKTYRNRRFTGEPTSIVDLS